jgi:hydroxymethylpyrimidine kinase / phosphomethylpyrimidine kinase / thiamine-phosphate diphosphorylase
MLYFDAHFTGAMKHVLTIAGHDLSSGAGVTKDLEIFLALGLHPLSIPTSFVIQGPGGVSDLFPTPPKPFDRMLKTAKDEVRLDGIKIGVLGETSQVKAVSSFLKEYREKPIVVDPVIASKNGFRLMSDDGLRFMIRHIFPLSYLVTPNTDEASAILGRPIRNAGEMERAATLLSRLGPKNVLLKGGHLQGDPVDLLFDGNQMLTHKKVRIEREVHGTGCALSSLMLSFIVLGYPLREAFLEAESLMEELLKESYTLNGSGYWYSSLTRILHKGNERWHVLKSLHDASVKLQDLNMVTLIPDVQMNVGYAIREASGMEDVAAFPGRIGHSRGKVCFKGGPEFGVSSHVARLILTYMKHYPHMRACANLRYDHGLVERAKKFGMAVTHAGRREEPERANRAAGQSLDLLVEKALKGAGSPPDIIYDTGGIGKEPIIRLFARDPAELLRKMEMMQSWKIN